MSPEDVRIVAKALLDQHWQLDERGMNCYIECKHCFSYAGYKGWDYHPAMIIHKTDCPVLVAKDLLTQRK